MMTTPFNRAGSVLAHVLIMSAIMSIVAAGMISMVMMQYRVTAKVEQQTHGKKITEIALARLITHWNSDLDGPAGAPCKSIPQDGDTGGFNCSPAAGTCPCTCTPTPADANMPTIYVTNSGAPTNLCIVNINTPEIYGY